MIVSFFYRNEETLLEGVTRQIFQELNRTSRPGLLGIEDRVEEMMKLLGIGSNEQDVRFLGLHGVVGVSKTTLAGAIYNRVSYHFEVCRFIASISEGAKEHGLAALQINSFLKT